MVRKVVLPLLLASCAALTGCFKSQPAAAPAAPPEVVVAFPVTETVTDYEEFPGRVDAVYTVQVRARAQGYLTEVDFVDGQAVEEGDALAIVQQDTYEAQLRAAKAQVGLAQANLKIAQVVLTRALESRTAAAPLEIDQDQAMVAQTEASLKLAQANQATAQLNFDYTVIRAPITGRISRRMVDPGNIVKTDDTILTTIVSLDPVYVYFDIDERTMLALERFSQKTGTPVPWKTDTLPRSNASATGLAFGAKVVTQKTSAPRFFGLKTAGLVGGGGALPWKFGMPVALGLADEDAYPHNGTINFADNVVNRQTGTLRVRGEFDNPTKLLQSGMFCRVRVPIGGAHDAVLVADKALSTDQSRKYLFVLDSNNKASQRDVKVGALHGSLRVVEGVGRDERVVVEGLQRVKAGSEVAPKLTDMIQTKGTREPVVVTNQAGGEKSSTK